MERSVLGLVASAMLVGVLGCGDDSASPACDEDTRIDCTCHDTGARGFVACDDGVLGACVCSAPDGGTDVCNRDVQCDDGAFCNGEELCLPDSPDADERGCVHDMFVPFCEDDIDCTIDRCSNTLNRCVFEAPDADGDGHPSAACTNADGEPLGDDCDDDDELSFPGNFEVCDDENRDEDCNPETFGDRDVDGDGAIDDACCNGDNCGDDCDDSKLSRRPLQVEFCDEVDNDCDGTIDEEAVEVPWYSDGDGDGFGAGNDVLESCIPIPGRSLVDTDCADDNAARHPGQLEICDFADNNCNDVADEGSECGVPLGYPVGMTGGALGGSGTGASGAGGSGSGGSGGTGGGGGTGGSGSGGSGGGGAGADAGTPIVLPDLIECPTRDVTGATQVSGTINDDTTWSGVVHMTGDTRLGSIAHLTIMPGTTVIAETGTSLTIGYNTSTSRITAVGTEDEPIAFCGKAALAGYWQGVVLANTTDPASELAWVLVADGGSSGGALRIEAPVPIRDVHVTNASGVGIEADDFGPGSTRVISSGNGGAPLSLLEDPAVNHLPTDSSWIGNGSDMIEIGNYFWNSDVTVADPGVPYFVSMGLQLRGLFTYVFEAGVEFVMPADSLFVLGWNSSNSTIEANGTASAPVVFRGATANAGFWGGVDVVTKITSSSYLRYVEVRDGGGTGVSALEVNAPILLDHVTVDNSQGTALTLVATGVDLQSNNLTISNTDGLAALVHADAMTRLGTSATFTGNTSNWIEVQQSTDIVTTGTIRDLGVPYYLPYGTRTRTGTTLTIEPGVEFLMGTGTTFEVGWNSNLSSIVAVGTAANPIVFRHVDGMRGGWTGMIFGREMGIGSKLQYVQLLDGGGASANGNLYINMNNTLPAANLANCTFDNGAGYGIYLFKDYLIDYTANGNVFGDNTAGDINSP